MPRVALNEPESHSSRLGLQAKKASSPLSLPPDNPCPGRALGTSVPSTQIPIGRTGLTSTYVPGYLVPNGIFVHPHRRPRSTWTLHLHICSTTNVLSTVSQSTTVLYSFANVWAASSIEFELGSSSKSHWFVTKHMSTLILRFGVDAFVFSRGSKNDIEVLPTPGGTCHVVGRENDIFQVLAIRGEDHDTIRCENCDPEIAFSAADKISIDIFPSRVITLVNLLDDHSIRLTK